MDGRLTRCTWSVGSRYRPQGYCGRKTIDGEHCAQHAKMAARVEAANNAALETLRAALIEGKQHER